MNKQLEEGLDKYRRKLNVIKHQTGLLYKDFHEKQQQWINEREQTTEIKRDLQTEIEKNVVKLQEFDVKFLIEFLFFKFLFFSVFLIH
jgi:centrosomal protein CEP290